MGKNNSKIHKEEKQKMEEVRPLTPLELWNSSEHTHEDMLIFMETTQYFEEWLPTITPFLASISHREKYQNYVILLLQYLKSDSAATKTNTNNLQQVFTLYSNRLKNSYFTMGQFHESHIDLTKTPADKLAHLYEYYSLSEDLLNAAVLHNYPTILTQFPLFVNHLLQSQVIVTNLLHFSRFIIAYQQLQLLKQHFEVCNKFYVNSERQKLLREVESVDNMKQIYKSVAEELLKYDYADLAGVVFSNLLRKGYRLSEEEMEGYLKVELYSLFLYELGKISLKFQEINRMTVVEILHYFFTQEGVQFTPELIKCFNVFPSASERWGHYIGEYVFSPISHLSVLVRLLEHGHMQLTGSMGEFQRLVCKLMVSRCQIGKYAEFLYALVDRFQIIPQKKVNYLKWIKSIQILYTFNINSNTKSLYEAIHNNELQGVLNNSSVREEGLRLINQIVKNYYTNQQIKNRVIVIDSQQFVLTSNEDWMDFLHVFKEYLFSHLISDQAFHQIVFRELIRLEQYETVKLLLTDLSISNRSITYETIELLVIDHIIQLITTNRIKKVQINLLLLLNIIKLSPSSRDITHYILAYYHYYKYLEDKDINFTITEKQSITLQHLYRIANDFTNKIDNVDFNYLYALQSCIKSNYSHPTIPFTPIVTDQFLKFKVYLCSRAFTLKKTKLGNEIVQEIVRFEPPWISTELIKICKENPNCDEHFITIAFNYCARGEDLEYILSFHEKNKANIPNRLSLKNIRNLGKLLKDQHYLMLADDLILDEKEYMNLVAELAFNEEAEFKSKHQLFFKLMGIEPQRSFYYAVNYNVPVTFVVNFIGEAVRKGIISSRNILPYIIKYLFFLITKEISNTCQYIRYKQYCAYPLEEVLKTDLNVWRKMERVNSYAVENLFKMIGNYKCLQIANEQFLSLYVNDNQRYRFIFDDKYRKDKLVELRDQPMGKADAFILKRLCEMMSIDIVELSFYNLYSKINLNDEIDNQSWTIVQKLIYWGEDREVGCTIVQKLGQKIVSMKLLVSIIEYMRESEQVYKHIVTDDHLQILASLAAVEGKNDLYGIISDEFFEREISVYPDKSRTLSDTHLRILKQFSSLTNIFVISKALYFMYGCNEDIERMVLSEFSLQQEDSQQFQMLRKKIKSDI